MHVHSELYLKLGCLCKFVCGVKTLKQVYPYIKCLQMKDYHLGVKAFQVSELVFFTIVPVFVTDVSQKLFLFNKFNFCFFFQVEIYILFKYIFLWNQVSLDGELVCHPLSALFCVACSWVMAVLLKFREFDYLCHFSAYT